MFLYCFECRLFLLLCLAEKYLNAITMPIINAIGIEREIATKMAMKKNTGNPRNIAIKAVAESPPTSSRGIP